MKISVYALPGLKKWDEKCNENKLYDIMDIVSEVTCISVDAIRGKSRKTEIVAARHLFFYFARTYTVASLEKIGSFTGGHDHATVRLAVLNMQYGTDLKDLINLIDIRVNRTIKNDIGAILYELCKTTGKS